MGCRTAALQRGDSVVIRLFGSGLILLSACLYLIGEKKACRQQGRTVQDLLSALENIKTAIRWEKQTLPDSIDSQKKQKYAGMFFHKITLLLQSNMPLQEAWEEVFSTIKPVEISKILCDISLSGDSTFLQDQFTFAAEGIRKFQAEKRAEQNTRQKLQVTATLCGAGVIIILLL